LTRREHKKKKKILLDKKLLLLDSHRKLQVGEKCDSSPQFPIHEINEKIT